MRKITLFKSMLVAIGLIVSSASVSAQVLLTEDFDYSVGQIITATATADPMTGWLSHSGTGTANIAVTSGLTFAGYAGSGVGGAAILNATGEDINKTFTSQNSGVIYASFILQPAASNAAGYIFMFSPAPVSSSFTSRVWVNATGNGVGVGASAPSYVSITAGVPVLLVVKYDFTSKATSLFVLNSYSSTEPASANQTFTETSPPASIGAIALRQHTAGQNAIIDGIRVAKTWAEAVAPTYTLPVATPTFSAVPGIYINAQTVALSSTTAGASIYYTTDGTTPVYPIGGSTTSLYTGTPLNVSTTTTIKAIAYLDGAIQSNIATGIFTFPTAIASISDLRAASQTGFYKLTSQAVITYQAVNATGKPRFIQDETAGVMLYDGSTKTTAGQYNLYDGLTNVVGTLTTYQGMLEFVIYADPGAATSTSNNVTIKEVAPDKLGDYIGQLVKVKNVTITGTGNFAASTSYPITDGTLTGKIRTQYAVADIPYIGTAIPSTKQDITGVVNINNTTETVLIPRSSSDMSTVTGLTQPTTSMKIAVVDGQLVFDAKAGEAVTVYNAVGQKLISKLAIEGRNAYTVSAHGVVFVKVGTQTAKVVL